MHIVDIVMIAVICLTASIIALTVLLSCRWKMGDEDTIARLGRRLRNKWVGSCIAFLIVYYWCVLISILSTLIVLYLGCFEDATTTAIKGRLIMYSAFSLFTSVCPYVVNFQKISRKYRKAFCIIDAQLLQQQGIVEAINLGEEIISSAFDE